MSYKVSLARQTYEVAKKMEVEILDLLKTTEGPDRETLLGVLVSTRKLQDRCVDRMVASEAQTDRRRSEATVRLPAPRSNHDGA